MNNKGQTLVLFLFLFPVVFLLFMGFYQIGTIQLEKKKLESAVKDAVSYGASHWNEEDVKDTMMKMIEDVFPNLNGMDIRVEVETGIVRMTIKKEYRVLFVMKQEMEIFYEGLNMDGKIEITKDRG